MRSSHIRTAIRAARFLAVTIGTLGVLPRLTLAQDTMQQPMTHMAMMHHTAVMSHEAMMDHQAMMMEHKAMMMDHKAMMMEHHGTTP